MYERDKFVGLKTVILCCKQTDGRTNPTEGIIFLFCDAMRLIKRSWGLGFQIFQNHGMKLGK